MKSNITELKKIENKFKKIIDEAEALAGKITVTDILTETFVSEHTSFSNIHEMIDKSGFTVETQKDLGKIPDNEWDQFISQNSSFENWKEMLLAAMVELAKQK